MSNVKRSEIYAELHGVEVVDGEFVDMTHTVVGRHGDIAKYVARAKKLYPDFLAREVHVYRATFAMSIVDFMAHAQPVGEPVDITDTLGADNNDTPEESELDYDGDNE